MATVIDALIVSLALEPSKFVKGTKDAEQQLKKTKDIAVGHGKDIEHSMRSASDGVGKLVTAFLGLTAVLTGGRAIKDFIATTTKNDAAVGQFAANLNMSSKDIQAWGGAVESMGGSASDAQASIQSLSDTFQRMQLQGGDPNFFRALAQI